MINSTGESLSFTSPNKIIFKSAGTYLIQFSTLAENTTANGDLGASMLINGVIIPTASAYTKGFTVQKQYIFQHNYKANTNDILTFYNKSTVSNNYHDATVSIIKLA